MQTLNCSLDKID